MRRETAVGAVLTVLAVFAPAFVFAQSATSTAAADLQRQIDDNNAQISQLDREIAAYQTQLDSTTKQKNTLQNTINQLTLQGKQLTAKISVTKSQINTTQLQIQQLAGSISDTQSSIDTENAGLAESLRRLASTDAQPSALFILTANGISGVWDDINAQMTLQSALNQQVNTLASHKQTLTTTKTTAEQKRAQLLQQQKTLAAQQGSLNATKKAQSDLLAQTKSQESAYQAIIAQKMAQEASIEAALNNLKSQFNVTVTANQIPPAGKGILHWPIAGTIRITQYFGNTPFAQAHAALYSGNGHDGMDIAAPIGTPVHAALAGTVLATGNTDSYHGTSGAQCYSFGKWVMLKHANGLSTMYAHLSVIDASPGQSVSTGDAIGYSGETGYATGPHLHFGVYVSAVTKIIPLGQATKAVGTPCSQAIMPVPPVSGYLNPLNYLP